MTIGLKEGNGRCGHCGTKMEEHTKGAAVIVSCHGCGIVVGRGADAEAVLSGEVAAGRARRIDSEPGTMAVRMMGGPVS